MLQIKNVLIISMAGQNVEPFNGTIVVDGDRLVYVGPDSGFQGAPDEWVDAGGKLALPGLVNAHTHTPMSLLRSYADDLPLHEWLNDRIFPAEDRLTEEDAYWGAMLSAGEMIRTGTTSFVDMYFHMDAVAQAVDESGLRAVLSRGIVPSEGEKKLREGVEFARKWRGRADGRISTMLGPHAPYTCPPPFLKEVAAAARDERLAVHIHLAETGGEVAEMREKYGLSPIELVYECGLCEIPMLAAHAVCVDEHDIRLLAENHAGVAHCPRSNLKLASGIAPLTAMLDAGVAVGIGTDSASSNNNLDMFEEMRLASLLAKGSTSDPIAVPAPAALRLATAGGAAIAGLSDRVGRLEAGLQADLILVGLNRFHLAPDRNPTSLMVYSAKGADVTDAMVAGKWLMRDRQLTTIDEDLVVRKANEAIRRIACEA